MSFYLLDTNIFIEAKKRFYDFDVCPAFWEWLLVKFEQKELASISMVLKELNRKKDKLTDWANELPEHFFLEPTEKEYIAYETVSKLVHDTWGSNAGKFLNKADSLLIAFALANDYTVVTQERNDPENKELKIPSVCKKLNVKCMNCIEMLKKEKVRFVLDKK